jgi:hypothetical protein
LTKNLLRSMCFKVDQNLNISLECLPVFMFWSDWRRTNPLARSLCRRSFGDGVSHLFLLYENIQQYPRKNAFKGNKEKILWPQPLQNWKANWKI